MDGTGLMDSEMTALTTLGASTLVALMATDGWREAKAAVGTMWRRAHPERAQAAETELEAARSELLAAAVSGDGQVAAALARIWQAHLGHLLEARPDLVGELRRILEDDLEPALARSAPRTVQMHARASEQARVFQAARDQHITGQ